jgi:transposase/uncharacterized coiled-coil protein SlyX
LTRNQSRIIELESQLSSQAQLIGELLDKHVQLEAKIALLEQELSYYRHKKDSVNSSIPPSQDPHRLKRTESLREKSTRKVGGQPGHPGSFLELSPTPTEVVVHVPHYCTCCGKDLSDIPCAFIGRRQVIDIPPVQPVVSEHQIYSRRCHCGHLTCSDYPVEAHSAVSYGARLQALTAYFHTRQYIPYERMGELYREIFGLSISGGSLANMVQSFANKCVGIYGEIRRRISQSPVVGADETGVCINGKNGWAWVFQTPDATYIHAGDSRGKKVIDELFPQGFPKTVLVHDCWPSYFSVPTDGHQICTAHLLRELKYLDKLYSGQEWTSDFTGLLHKALELKKTFRAEDYKKTVKERALLEEQLDQLLDRTIDSKHKKLTTFKKRIEKYRNYLFAFLYHPQVTPDNNASERAIRTYKVKQKVSGLFRAKEGAKAFAVIRSIIDTTIKNMQNVWQALALIPCIHVKVEDG